MRKLTAIFFILVLFFYFGGYQLWISHVQEQSDKTLELALDKQHYNDNELITISVPLSDAYQNDWSDFKRIDGEITYNGILYKYVKQKVQDGRLILKCLANHDKMKIESGKNELVKNSLDLSGHSKKQDHSKFRAKGGINEFVSNMALYFIKHQNIHADYTVKLYIQKHSSTFHRSPEQPPDGNA